MPAANNWYVITGGPSSGKSTLIEELAKLGYKTHTEAARLVIDETLATGQTLAKLRADEQHFQRMVVDKKIEQEGQLDQVEVNILDRGMQDSLAYLQAYNWHPDAVEKSACQKAQYKKVFLLEQLPSFTTDYARTEDAAFAKKLSLLLNKVYKAAGMTPIKVPVMPVKDRLQFIIERMDAGDKHAQS